MKSPTKKATLLKDYQRLAEWRNGRCPYCKSNAVLFNGLSTKEIWGCNDCGICNIFSGAILKRKEER